MAPRATSIKEQGFSEAVAARIEAPQRRSTRSVYEAKWAIFTKWCISNQVEFNSPPVKSVADFLLYLFEVKKLQPSTIDGYRSTIADKLGNSTLNISKDDNLTRLLDSFHRDRPKGTDLSLVLHQLTKAPFEPLREASLKHLTFKTVFLLALGSGKRRSEIHAWQHRNITLHQVKAHDVRAFAASKAFQSGVSLEQILSACHWKSHNTFTQFYLKDVAWADSELYHLGPVVAAQQIYQQTGT